MKKERRALIVDDSESVLMVLDRILQDAGILAVEATDARTALTLAKKQVFDIVITDINMPNMDGIVLIKKLRQLKKYHDIPILSLTNLNSDNIKQRIKNAGASGWMQKPVGRVGLLNAIERLIG